MITRFICNSSQHLSLSKHREHIHSYLSKRFFQTSSKSNSITLMDTDSSAKQHEEMRAKAHKICSDHLGGAWSRISQSEMSFTPVSGGMSNAIYCCSLPESFLSPNSDVPSQVLLRLYGDLTNNCDISIQLEIFKMLSSKNLGPKLYSQFEEGRLEEFLPANSLTCEEFTNRDISAIIAKKLAVVHSLAVPMAKTNTWLLDKYYEWLEFISTQVKVPAKSDDIRQSTIDIAEELLSVDFRAEINFLTDVFNKSNSPTVFSHNDLHQGNILLAKKSKRRPTLDERVFIIDFEYCSYNYRAYDIANHFSEWCFEYDTPEHPHFKFYDDRFPSDEAQADFIRNYVVQSQQSRSICAMTDTDSETTNVKESHCDSMTSSDGDHLNGHMNVIKDKTMHHDLLNEIKPFFMAANLLWTMWCIKSAKSSTIKFGYWEHAMARWRFYSGFKDAYLAEASNNALG